MLRTRNRAKWYVSTVRGREEVDPNAFENTSEKFEAYFPLRNHKGVKNNEF